jgi:hypothetical protein
LQAGGHYLSQPPVSAAQARAWTIPGRCKAFGYRLEEKQIFSVWNVISNRLVTSDELHIADLAFSGKQETILIAPSIVVAILLSRFSSEQEQKWLVGRR